MAIRDELVDYYRVTIASVEELKVAIASPYRDNLSVRIEKGINKELPFQMVINCLQTVLDSDQVGAHEHVHEHLPDRYPRPFAGN